MLNYYRADVDSFIQNEGPRWGPRLPHLLVSLVFFVGAGWMAGWLDDWYLT